MRIEKIQIQNYKSYGDSGPILLGPRSSVIVGQNNAGKTAFLETLAIRTFEDKPHRVPPPRDRLVHVLDPYSRVNFDVVVSGRELLQRMLSRNVQIQFLVPPDNRMEPRAAVSTLFESEELHFKLQMRKGPAWSTRVAASHGLFHSPLQEHVRVGPTENMNGWQLLEYAGGPADNLPDFVGDYLADSVYVFRAERMAVGECGIDASEVLRTDAQNLPSVLLQLAKKPLPQMQYREFLSEIFPHLYDLRSVPVSHTQTRITVINNDSEKHGCNPGIDIPLKDSGTGISQVAAILYVVVTAEAPKIIVIDEPNSFLHPGAAKKLMTILSRLPHQFIIATHSADIINAADPDALHLVTRIGNTSHFLTLDRKNKDDQSRLLDELGVRLSDVFGFDNVLWVEGSTEERAFPLLLKHRQAYSPTTAILSLVATGDLEGHRSHSDLALQIYERLSKGTALIPPALAISMDTEDRTADQISDLVQRSRGLVKFLPRRTYENYLLHPEAIASILSPATGGSFEATASKVDKWLSEHKPNNKYYKAVRGSSITAENWERLVDAPRLLYDLFRDLSEATLIFRKPNHSVDITKWLLEHEPDHVQELIEYVVNLVRR